MKTLAFISQKGGVTKSSTLGNIASIMAKADKKTLLIDLDGSQGNLYKWMRKSSEPTQPKLEVGDYLFSINDQDENEARNLKNCILNVRENLDLVPTKSVNSSLKNYVANKISSDDEFFSFGTLISDAKELGYEFVFFDLAPAFTALEKRLTLFIDEVIPITDATFFGMQGVITNNKETQRLASVHNQFRKKPLIRNKIVLSAYNKGIKDHKDAYEELQKSNIPVYVIRTAVLVDKLQKRHLFIGEGEEKHLISKDYLTLARMIIEEAQND